METDKVAAGTITDWDDKDWEKFHRWLTNILFNNESVEVIFTKADGTERVMNCTLYSARVARTPAKPNARKKVVSEATKQNNVTVFDVDKNEWRSFKLRNITNILALIMKYGDIK